MMAARRRLRAAGRLSAAGAQFTYTLDSGDRLRVVVFGQEGLTNSYVVDASGQIAMPLIGTVPARGSTTDQLSRPDRRECCDRVSFASRMLRSRSRPIGRSSSSAKSPSPANIPISPNMTVETAVAIAGGFGPRALHNPVDVSRNYNGQQFRFQTPLTSQIRPGDTIQVKERWF